MHKWNQMVNNILRICNQYVFAGNIIIYGIAVISIIRSRINIIKLHILGRITISNVKEFSVYINVTIEIRNDRDT
jgi:hypothetical protein